MGYFYLKGEIMAEKRFYWLKLKEDYFNNPKIKKLRKIAGGDTFTIIYLKMQLLSISNKGIITFEGIEQSFEEELALKLDEEVEDVKLTLAYLNAQSLIENNENEFLLPDACKNIGSECDSAERVRLFRERENKKMLQCNKCVTEVKQNSISISKSISNSNKEEKKVKHKYGEYNHILLTDEELEKLNNEFGEEKTQKAITFLDEYIEMKGYKAKSHYLCMRKWVFNAVEEQEKKNKPTKADDGLTDFDRKFLV